MTGIIILTKDNRTELFKCIESIYKYTHIDYKLFIADTGSTDDVIYDTAKHLGKFKGLDYEFIRLDHYKYTENHNTIIRDHFTKDIDTICFMNNDVTLRDVGSIDRMYQIIENNRTTIGVVGCRLLYPDGDKIQHDGQKFILPKDRLGSPYFTHTLQHESHKKNPRSDAPIVSGVTFALALTPVDLYKSIGGLNEAFLSCFDDVMYSMKANLTGRANVIIESDYYAIHHESLTRGKPEGKELANMQHDYNVIRKFVIENMGGTQKMGWN